MKTTGIFVLAIFALVLASCAGSTEPEEQLGDAFKADLIEHQGDTGNIIKDNHGNITDTLNFYYDTDSTFYEKENNGIDAYHEGNWIIIRWNHITDTSTSSLELFRFSYLDYQNNLMDSTKSIKFIPYNIFTDDYCIDNFDNDTEAVNTTWFYYLKTTHLNGSVAYSDTVGYKLVNKPQLQVPANMAEYAQTDSIIFEWDKNNTNTLIQDRLLIFDDSYNLIWFYNLVADEEPLINFAEISGIELDTGGYIWRVDAVIDYYDELYLNSQKIRVHSGAESMERYFTVVD